MVSSHRIAALHLLCLAFAFGNWADRRSRLDDEIYLNKAVTSSTHVAWLVLS